MWIDTNDAYHWARTMNALVSAEKHLVAMEGELQRKHEPEKSREVGRCIDDVKRCIRRLA